MFFLRTPVGLEDVSKYPNLVAELIRRGYSDDDISKVTSMNLLRVFAKVESVCVSLAMCVCMCVCVGDVHIHMTIMYRSGQDWVINLLTTRLLLHNQTRNAGQTFDSSQ